MRHASFIPQQPWQSYFCRTKSSASLWIQEERILIAFLIKWCCEQAHPLRNPSISISSEKNQAPHYFFRKILLFSEEIRRRAGSFPQQKIKRLVISSVKNQRPHHHFFKNKNVTLCWRNNEAREQLSWQQVSASLFLQMKCFFFWRHDTAGRPLR